MADLRYDRWSDCASEFGMQFNLKGGLGFRVSGLEFRVRV